MDLFNKNNDSQEYVESQDGTFVPKEEKSVAKTDATTPAFNPVTFGNSELDKMTSAINAVNNVSMSLTESVKVIASVSYEIKKLDHEFNLYMEQSNQKLERFRAAMPVLEKQLNSVSTRIDKITDSMLDNIMDAKDEMSVKKHEMLLSMLTDANNSFNNMLAKLISL